MPGIYEAPNKSPVPKNKQINKQGILMSDNMGMGMWQESNSSLTKLVIYEVKCN